MSIKVESWSSCEGCWMYYGAFGSIEEVKSHINKKGYDPTYFRPADSPDGVSGMNQESK